MEGRQPSVLVVDDDSLVRKAIRLTCEAEGYAVTEVERGNDALGAIEAVRPDIVLLDLMLPDQSGFDICPVSYTHLTLPTIYSV